MLYGCNIGKLLSYRFTNVIRICIFRSSDWFTKVKKRKCSSVTNVNEMIQGRIVELMSHFKLTAGALAEAIGVQPSSVSHVLSGRNRPSLDFVLRILEQYPEVSSDWLLHGSGKMLKQAQSENPLQGSLFGSEEESEAQTRPSVADAKESGTDAALEQSNVQSDRVQEALAQPQRQEAAAKPPVQKPAPRRGVQRSQSARPDVAKARYEEANQQSQRRIERIIIFYSDHTFEQFSPTGGSVDKL